MIDVFFKALVKAFKASPVPKAAPVVPAPAPKVIATSPAESVGDIHRIAVPLAIAGVRPLLPITKTSRDPFSIEDRVLNPLNPLAIAGADPLKANIWWD